MKNINLFTVLSLFQFLHLIFIGWFCHNHLGVSSTADIIISVYFTGNLNIFVVLMCADVIYNKLNNK